MTGKIWFMEEWPPDGYGNPREWEKSEKAVALIAGLLTVVFIGKTQQSLTILGGEIFDLIQWMWAVTGVTGSAVPMFGIGILVVGGAALLLAVAFQKVVIPIHERIHYEIDRVLGLNPEYTYQYFLFMKNPCVIPVSAGISLWENTLSTLGPFVIIGVASGGIMILTEGVVAGLAALVLVTNSAGSAADIYTVMRFVQMPRGTLFANFKVRENGYQKEYVFPE